MTRQDAATFLRDFGAIPAGTTPFQRGAMYDGVIAYNNGAPNTAGNGEYEQYFQSGWLEASVNVDEWQQQ